MYVLLYLAESAICICVYGQHLRRFVDIIDLRKGSVSVSVGVGWGGVGVGVDGGGRGLK